MYCTGFTYHLYICFGVHSLFVFPFSFFHSSIDSLVCVFILCPFVLVCFGCSSVCLFLPLFFPCFLSSFIRFVVHWFCCFITVHSCVFSFLHSSVPVFLVFLILYVLNSGLLGQYSSVSTIRGPIEAHYSITLLFLGQKGAKKKIFQRSLGCPPSDY